MQHLIYEDASSKNIISNGDFEKADNWALTETSTITDNAPIKENGSTANKVMAFTSDSILGRGLLKQ